jgi:hypothetical protein
MAFAGPRLGYQTLLKNGLISIYRMKQLDHTNQDQREQLNYL